MSEKAHLLIIDDEKNYLLVLQTLLEDEGYAVTAISDPETAVQFWQLVQSINGEEWLNNHLFRYGASRLLNKLVDAIV